ncbi:MAG: sugar phosphate nucleotidyltransferase [bacterium]|nr:sugar phosphate nucleotidyltransferase [bacterium]
MRYAVILAGGSGTRLWPLSRRRSPKQIHALLDDETLLQKTYRRVCQMLPVERIAISTNAEQATEVRRQLPMVPENRMFSEPVARNTAAAIAYAAVRLVAEDPEAVFVTVNSDAHVRDVGPYLRAIDAAMAAAETHGVALVGIAPSYPETGYGYIELAAPVTGDIQQPVRAVRFVEKPDAATAHQFVESGRYLWNPALFAFRAATLLELCAIHLPEHARALTSLRDSTGPASVTRAFLSMPNVSIDYGIMEKLRDLTVIPASFGWADVGSWRAVHEILASDSSADVVRGTHVGVAGKGNLVVAPPGKVVATYGLEGYVIIDTKDAVLICPRDRAQGVKEIVAELERRGLTEYL